ncbi:MAG: CvpA family protein [Thermoguttaceae bacterium]
MTSFDFVLILLLLFLAWRGWRRGIITQVTSVVGLVVGSFAALRGSVILAPLIPLQDPLRYYVAMVLLFVGAVIAAHIVGRVVRGAVNLLYLGWLDHLVGLALGVVKCVLIAVVIIFGCVMVSETTGRWVTQSFSGPFGVAIIRATERMIPPDVCERLHEQLAKFDAKVNTISNGASAEWTLPNLSKEVANDVKKVQSTLGPDTANNVANAVVKEATKLVGETVAKESPALAGWLNSVASPATAKSSPVASASTANAREPAPAIVDELKPFVAAMFSPATDAVRATMNAVAPNAGTPAAAVTSFWESIAPVAQTPQVAAPVAPFTPPTPPTPSTTPRFDPAAWADALKR